MPMKQPVNIIIEKRLKKKYRILYNYIEDKAKINSKIKILNRRGNEKINKMIKNEVEYDGEEHCVTRKAQLQKYENVMPNTDSTNDSIRRNCCTSVSRNNNNNKKNNIDNKDGEEEINNTETNTVTTSNGRNKEASEAKVNSESSKSRNGRSSSNNKCYYMETKILKHPDENKNKMIGKI